MVRIARSSGLVDGLARVAVRGPGADGWDLPFDPDSATESAPVASHDPQALVVRAKEAAALLDDRAFVFVAPDRLPLPQVRAVGILRAFAMVFSAFGRAFRRVPAQAVTDVRGKVLEVAEDRASEFAFGGDPLRVARLAGQLGERDLPLAKDVPRLADESARILDLLGRPGRTGPRPGLWKSLRQFCFGAIDASELPSAFETPFAGARRQVIRRPELIAPSPRWGFFRLIPDLALGGIGLSDWSNTDISSCDPHRAARLNADLEGAVRELDRTRGDERTGENRRLAEQIEAERARLRTWVALREPCFLWGLGVEVAGQLAKAIDFVAQARPIVLARIQIDFDEPTQLRRRLYRTWCWVLVLAAIVITTVWVWGALRPMAGALTLAAAVVCLVASFLFYWRYLAALNRWEARAQQSIHAYKQAVLDLYEGSEQLARLSAVYDQFVDWAEIIGWIVHEPWSDYGAVVVDERSFVPEAAKAIVLLDVPEDAGHRDSLGRQARRTLFGPGWLGPVFEAASALAGERAALDQGLGSGRPQDPDLDTPFESNGARNALVALLRSTVPQDAQQDRARDAVAGFCEQLSEEEVFPNSIDIDGRPTTIHDFLDVLPTGERAKALDISLWDSEGQVTGANSVSRTDLWQWSPADVDDPHVRRDLAMPTTDTRGAYLLRSVRVDRTERTPVKLWTMFTAPSVGPVEAESMGGSDIGKW